MTTEVKDIYDKDYQAKLKEEFKNEVFDLIENKYVDLHCAVWQEVFDELYYNPFLSNGF